jgi:hypothetical protein
MRLFVTGLLEQAKRHNLCAELVIVEWNPPSNQPRLVDMIEWPTEAGSCTVRIIEVSPELHRYFENSDKLPFFQFIAKNVGIRRARSRFILATNMDILFSDELFRFFAAGQLQPERMYRIDRHDVRSDIPDEVSVEQQLNYCHENVIKIYTRGKVITLDNGNKTPLLRGYLNSLRRRFKSDTPAVLHTNACGDFTLMAREHWLAVRGYAEFGLRGFKTDGLLCYAAHYAGAREKVLTDPMRIYHIDHPARIDGAGAAERELSSDNRSLVLSREKYNTWVIQMCESRKPIIFNETEDWGLAAKDLPETVIVECHQI